MTGKRKRSDSADSDLPAERTSKNHVRIFYTSAYGGILGFTLTEVYKMEWTVQNGPFCLWHKRLKGVFIPIFAILK